MRSRRPFHPARRRNPFAWHAIDPIEVSTQTAVVTDSGQPYSIFSPDEVRAFIEYLYLVEQSCPPELFPLVRAVWLKGAPYGNEWFFLDERSLETEEDNGVQAQLLFVEEEFRWTTHDATTFLWSTPYVLSASFTYTTSTGIWTDPRADGLLLDDVRATGDWNETDFTFTYTRAPHPAFSEPAMIWLTMEQRELLHRARQRALDANDEELLRIVSEGLRGNFLMVPWERANRWGLVFAQTIEDEPGGAALQYAVTRVADSWFRSRLASPRR